MLNRIYAFIMAIIAFFSSLFGLGNYGKVNTYYDVHYGSGEREVYDLVVPKGAKGETNLLLLIHGGAWISGKKRGEGVLVKEQHLTVACGKNTAYVFSAVGKYRGGAEDGTGCEGIKHRLIV